MPLLAQLGELDADDARADDDDPDAAGGGGVARADVDLLKIDVEGDELEVWAATEGAARVQRRRKREGKGGATTDCESVPRAQSREEKRRGETRREEKRREEKRRDEERRRPVRACCYDGHLPTLALHTHRGYERSTLPLHAQPL